MDLGDWLRSLGLGQYEAAFRENAIDRSVLSDLTDQDLEKLGVLVTVAPAAVDTSPRDAAERRQVTVMFSDLVGSTALSAWTQRTSARSFQPTRSASQRSCIC
jgi:class 3 adenylate cyclase